MPNLQGRAVPRGDESKRSPEVCGGSGERQYAVPARSARRCDAWRKKMHASSPCECDWKVELYTTPTMITDATSLKLIPVVSQIVKPDTSDMQLTTPFITSKRYFLLKLTKCRIYERLLVELLVELVENWKLFLT